jgi:hypothetical protein
MKVKVWVDDKLANALKYDNGTSPEEILRDIPRLIRSHTKKKNGKLAGIRRDVERDVVTDIYLQNQDGPVSNAAMAMAARRRRAILGYNVIPPRHRPICPKARPANSHSNTYDGDYGADDDAAWFRHW